jgi:hypothetical protein
VSFQLPAVRPPNPLRASDLLKTACVLTLLDAPCHNRRPARRRVKGTSAADLKFLHRVPRLRLGNIKSKSGH